MTLQLPSLYHWRPSYRRSAIKRRGLVPKTPTAVTFRPQHLQVKGHVMRDYEQGEEVLAVCLGTTPGTAWAMSGYFAREPGDWDLWEVQLAATDEVHCTPETGGVLDEVRVFNRIPKSRVWYVATRTMTPGRRWHAG